MTEDERKELKMARRCDHCGKGFAEGSIHVCSPVDFNENLKRAMKPVEGAKFDANKPDHSLLPPDALVDIIRVYEQGVKKYGRDNWRKGLLYSRIFSAIMRHLWAWWKGSDINEEDGGVRHLAQAAWGCLTLLEYTRTAKYGHFDDRPVDEPWPVDPPLTQEEPYEFKPAPPPRGVLCFHEWEYDTSYSDTAGLHTRWRCKKCKEIWLVSDPPVSIPSVWVGDPNPVPYTITCTAGAFAGKTFLYQNGELKTLSKQEEV